jgi:hypothetical protein
MEQTHPPCRERRAGDGEEAGQGAHPVRARLSAMRQFALLAFVISAISVGAAAESISKATIAGIGRDQFKTISCDVQLIAAQNVSIHDSTKHINTKDTIIQHLYHGRVGYSCKRIERDFRPSTEEYWPKFAPVNRNNIFQRRLFRGRLIGEVFSKPEIIMRQPFGSFGWRVSGILQNRSYFPKSGLIGDGVLNGSNGEFIRYDESTLFRPHFIQLAAQDVSLPLQCINSGIGFGECGKRVPVLLIGRFAPRSDNSQIIAMRNNQGTYSSNGRGHKGAKSSPIALSLFVFVALGLIAISGIFSRYAIYTCIERNDGSYYVFLMLSFLAALVGGLALTTIFGFFPDSPLPHFNLF